ncbi:MAG: xanthine dehydrogenase family protein molybdopterin-binding subunit [Candidatus Eiseniibacteriota bacterium]
MEQPDRIGTGPVRLDAWQKVSGRSRYLADHPIEGAWLGATVRSPVARGQLRAIERDPAFDWSGVLCLTAAELPGPNVVAMIRDDHAVLADGAVRFAGEAVALLAAPDAERLAAAARAIHLDIVEEPAVESIEEALRPAAIIWGDDNVIAEYRIEDGDVEAGLGTADHVVDGTYRTGYQEHLYLEPNGMIARPRAGGGVEILGSLQCPYYVHAALCRALALDPAQVVVRQAVTGGAFGGKEDYPSVLAVHTAVLALAAGRPVRMIYERSEDIRATTKRHPSRTRIRTGVRRDGTLVAADIDLVLDAGAATTLSPVVLSRAVLHAAGAYRIPNVRIRGRAVATNTPPNGAFRGFGAPQSLFAIERQVDHVAARLGLDPLEVRRRNLLRDGDRLPFGQRLERDVGASLVLERAVALAGYEERRRRLDRLPGGDVSQAPPAAAAPTAVRRGIGLAVCFHGGGFTGAGEERIRGRAGVRITAEGTLEILVSSVEMGQGASTVLAMIAARALGLPLEAVRHVQPDTSVVPDSGPTVASRTTMIVGQIVIQACRALVDRLRERLAATEGVDAAAILVDAGGVACAGRPLGDLLEVGARLAARGDTVHGEATYSPPAGVRWDEERYRGDAYKAYSWAADVVEVEVDRATLEVRPTRVVSVVELGRAIHPVLAIGQIEGGTLQALAWGYMEEVKTAHGHYLNDRMATYIIPTTLDVPEMQVELAGLPYEHGPFGAKGLGELPMDIGAPALAAAIDQATGVFNATIPITPERLHALLRERPGPDGAAPDGREP